MEGSLKVDQQGAIQRVILDHPKVNALTIPMVEELIDLLKASGANPSIRCLVLTGSGNTFCAGHDVREIQQAGAKQAYRYYLERTYIPLILAIRRIEKPIIGALNGPAAGAGLGIALATDIRIAAQDASLVFGFSRIGLTADSGVSLLLPLLVGISQATTMAFCGQTLTMDQALQCGIVSQVVPRERLAQQAAELAASLASGPSRAFGLTKRAFNRTWLPALEASLHYEAYLQDIASNTKDHQEGLAAFLEKRSPHFSGQ